jgi:hypothetical protein
VGEGHGAREAREGAESVSKRCVGPAVALVGVICIGESSSECQDTAKFVLLLN